MTDADEELLHAGVAFKGHEENGWPPQKPNISFAGYETKKATEIGDVHFCGTSCMHDYATKHGVLQFDKGY